jgi:LysR family transcriptional regulator, hypochlorite-specific transcription factor HypT
LDTKLLEDLAALAQTGSLSRAAALRHVTHPAFGRRIRQLEAWAGAPLVERGRLPLTLTAAGRALLDDAQPLVQGLARTRLALRERAGAASAQRLRVGTGRTLARTLVAHWLTRLRKPLAGAQVEVVTRSMADIAALFERGDVDLLCGYEHPALSMPLAAQRFRYVTLASDRLVPVTQADAHGRARQPLDGGQRIDYAPSLALGRLVREHLERSSRGEVPPALVCDSADAIAEFVRLGLGHAWLPWSLVAADCKQGLLVRLGGRAETIAFDVRLYRPKARQSPLVEAVWAATAG